MKIRSSVDHTTQKSETSLFPVLPVVQALALMATLFISTQAYALAEFEYAKPAGWGMLEKSAYTGGHYSNVHIYKNSLGNDSYDTIVALVDIAKGARVDMMQYDTGERRNGHSTFWMNSIEYWWNQMPTNSSRVLVVNGQFFGDGEKNRKATLSFAIKDNGHLYPSADPNSINKTAKQVNIFRNNVTVTDAYAGNYVEHHAPTAIIGRNINDLSKSGMGLGRTYLCAMPTIRGNVLLIYVAYKKTADQAKDDLLRWDCHENNTAALDGSGSTQMRTKGGNTLYGASNPLGWSDKREIPQVIGIYNDAH